MFPAHSEKVKLDRYTTDTRLSKTSQWLIVRTSHLHHLPPSVEYSWLLRTMLLAKRSELQSQWK